MPFLDFGASRASRLLKVHTFVKTILSTFSPSGQLTKWAKFVFSSFSNFRAFKTLQFCQKMSLSTFPPSGWLTKLAKFAISSFCSFRALWESLLSKEVFEYVVIKRTAYEMKKVRLFREFPNFKAFNNLLSKHLLRVTGFVRNNVFDAPLSEKRLWWFNQ